MSNRQRKALREGFFDRGTIAIKRYYDGEKYFCPICGIGFDRTALSNGELTLEHSPPKAVGGKPVALTCHSCNSGSGHLFESNLSGRAQLTGVTETILGERRNEPGRVSFQIGDVWLNTQLYQDEKGVRTLEVLKGNDPKAIDETLKYLNGLTETKTWDGQEFHIRSRVGYNHRLALIAELKAAFITAFAAFGYRYAFDPRLSCVREQILKPSETIIDGWNARIEHAQFSEFVLLYVGSIPGVVVKLGKSSVILPWVSGPDNLYKDLASRYQHGENIQITGKLLSWPSKLEMALDFQPRADSCVDED